MKLAVILGTRPQIIELAPVIHALHRDDHQVIIYHSGQHYDREMSAVFIKQLGIPEPDKTFSPASGTHAEQTARIMVEIERACMDDRPDKVILEGDTNTALAAGLAAVKLKIPIVHIEAGCRIHNKSLPEEVNRILISHMATTHCSPTSTCTENLHKEGITNVNQTGHPVVDSIELVKDKLTPIHKPGSYYYSTIHRDFNTDDPARLQEIITQLEHLDKPVYLAAHPRTAERLNKFKIDTNNINIIPPIDYIGSLSMIKYSYAVISDSGGLQKESTILGTPMITIRPNTEWPETLAFNANQLAISDDNLVLLQCVKYLNTNYHRIKSNAKKLVDVLGRPGTSEVIAKCV